MDRTMARPIEADWTRKVEASAGAATAASASDLVAVLAPLDHEDLERWRPELATAVGELHRVAGSPLRWSAEDSVVMLVRGLARLARCHPTATCEPAARLTAALAAHLRPAP